MKVVIVTAPMKPSKDIKSIQYPVDGNGNIEYKKRVRCPINGVLAKTLKKNDKVKVVYVMTTGKNSKCEQNKKNFVKELEGINKNIGAVITYDTVFIDFEPKKMTYNKLITDLSKKIPNNAEIFTDITFGYKPEILSLFCALRFVEEFRDAIVQYIVYGKAEFNKEGNIENPKLYDITSLYYLFKLMGTMGATDANTAEATLKEFFSM